jgi:glycosyltransferase involved in cell wall biosynthesis
MRLPVETPEMLIIVAIRPHRRPSEIAHSFGSPSAACGRPLVATDVPGCREIACPGVNGFLVPLDDIEALAEAIDRLALDPQLRRTRELVELKFSSQRIGRDVVSLYRRLLGRTD